MVRHYKTGEWTDARFELAARLWKEGLSATQIAKVLGGVSRNAVLGKLSRANLLCTRAPASAPTKAPREPAKMSMVRRANNGRIYPQPAARALPQQTMIEVTTARPWITRVFGECAFPVAGENADVMSCCGEVGGGGSYCEDHRKIVYSPRQPTRRSKDRRQDYFVRQFAA